MDLRPADAAELLDAVEGLRRDSRAAVVVGGGTLVHVGDPGPAEARLHTGAMDGVVAHEPADLTLTVGAGLTLAEAERVLGAEAQTLACRHPDPGRATLGGLLAFGWAGLGRRLYGPLRDRVLEVRAVTGSGRDVRGGGKVVKNVTGFDLPRLFCGSMGTLGVVHEVTFKVQPRARPLHGVRVADLDLLERVGDVRMPIEALLVRGARGWEGFALAPGPREDAETLVGPLGGTPLNDADGLFAELGADPLLCGRGAEIVVRVGIPPAGVPELCRELEGAVRVVVDAASGVAWAALGGAGSVQPLRRWAEDAGGSAVLLGAPDDLRREVGTWGTPPSTIELMRRLKASFDPDGVLAPGRFLV